MQLKKIILEELLPVPMSLSNVHKSFSLGTFWSLGGRKSQEKMLMEFIRIPS